MICARVRPIGLCLSQSHTARAASRAISTESVPLIFYGQRRVQEGKLDEFKERFCEHSEAICALNPGARAVFAFPDPADPLAFWHLSYFRDVHTWADNSARPPVDAKLHPTYRQAVDSDDRDTIRVYGGWNDDVVQAAAILTPAVRYDFHEPLAGFFRETTYQCDEPPMIGITKRFGHINYAYFT